MENRKRKKSACDEHERACDNYRWIGFAAKVDDFL